MTQLKKTLYLIFLMVSLSLSALADGAPAYQFGVRDWPYRAAPACGTARPAPVRTPAPTAKPTARPASAPAASVSVGDYTTLSVSAQEYSAWNLLNEDRAANGLEPLPLDETLCAIARVKSLDMNSNRYFAHESPTFGKPADMLRAFGYSFRGVGENIAHHATALKAEAAFMSSSGHKAIILGSQWSRVGIGICTDSSGYVYVTQLFAR